MCFWSPVPEICPIHEVVVLQPWTGTTPYLGYVSNYTSSYNPPAPPVSTNFLDLFTSPYTNAFPSVAFSVVAPLSFTHSPPSLLARSARIIMNKSFKNNDERKRKICDKSIHKGMRIPVDIHHNNKKFSVTVQPKIHVYWNFQIIYGYRFLTNHSWKFYFFQ